MFYFQKMENIDEFNFIHLPGDLPTLDSLIVVVHGDYFLEISPQNTSLLQWLLLLIFSSFPNTTIITLENVNNSGQRVSKFPQNFSKCPHNTIIPLSILNIFLKSPQNTLIPQTLLLRSLEYIGIIIYIQT